MDRKPLSEEQREKIRQVEATMSVENMPLTDEARKNLYAVASGEKTTRQIIDELKSKYKRK